MPILVNEAFLKEDYDLAKTLFENKHFEKALEKFTLLCISDSNVWEFHFAIGLCYQKLNNHTLAIIAFNSALFVKPKVAKIYLHIAESYISLSDLENSKKMFALALKYQEDKALKKRAKLLIKQNNLK